MALKIILGALLAVIVLVVILPLSLSYLGFQIFNLGTTPKKTTRVAIATSLLRSEHQGDAWNNVSVAPSIAAFPASVLAMAFHPQNPSIIFIGTNGQGLWRSSNMGKTWSRMNDAKHVLLPTASVYDVELSASNPEVMYVAVFQQNRGRVLVSNDGGSTFAEIYATTADTTGVFDVLVDSGNPKHVSIVTGQNGFLDSANGGETWRVRKWFSEPLVRITVNPRNPQQMFILTGSGKILRSEDAGNNWTELNAHSGDTVTVDAFPQGFSFFSFGKGGGQTLSAIPFIIDPQNSSVLYSGSAKGLLRSSDAGDNWARLNLPIPPEAQSVSAIAVHPEHAQTMFVAVGARILRSDDAGINWSMTSLPGIKGIKNIFIHPARPDIMFLVTVQ